MGVLRRLASQTALYGLSSIVGRLVNWMLTPIFTNVFATEEFGVLQDLFAFTYYPLIIITFGLETAFFRWAEDKDKADAAYTSAFSQVALFATVFGLGAGLLHAPLAAGLGYAGQADYILLLVIIIVLDTLAAIPLARLRFQEKAKWFAAISLSNVFITVVLNLVFIYGLGLRSVGWILMANVIASGIRLAMVLWRNLPSTFRPDRVLAKVMRTYGFYIMIAGLAGALNEVLGRNLIPRLWPAGGEWHGLRMNGWELNGIYSAMYKLGMFVALATQAFRYAAEPFFFRSAKDKDSPRQFARIFHYYTLATVAMLLLIGVFRQELVSFGWGNWHLIAPDYWLGLEAVPHILLANVLLGAYLNLSIWYKLTKQVRFALMFTGVGALITVVLNVAFIPAYGYMASAWAAVACYGFMVAVCYVLGQKYYPIPYQMGRPVLYTVIAWAAIAVCDWAAPTLPVPFIATATKAVLCAALLTLLVVWERNAPPVWGAGG